MNLNIGAEVKVEANVEGRTDEQMVRWKTGSLHHAMLKAGATKNY